jgi:hypothetical protein
MSISSRPWTFEPLEIDPEHCWQIYDPNTAALVATFYDYDRARDYLTWINKKQAKKKAEKDEKAKKRMQSWTTPTS